jgi:hypothetical protein
MNNLVTIYAPTDPDRRKQGMHGCLVSQDDGTLCRAPASILEHQRDGLGRCPMNPSRDDHQGQRWKGETALAP